MQSRATWPFPQRWFRLAAAEIRSSCRAPGLSGPADEFECQLLEKPLLTRCAFSHDSFRARFRYIQVDAWVKWTLRTQEPLLKTYQHAVKIPVSPRERTRNKRARHLRVLIMHPIQFVYDALEALVVRIKVCDDL